MPEKTRVTAKQMLDDLERGLRPNTSMVREVSMVDREESMRHLAQMMLLYPGYFDRHIEQRGIDPEMIPEVSLQDTINPTSRRIDALMTQGKNKYGEYPRTAIEVKVSRADFRRDSVEKRRQWQKVTHRFVYFVPKDMISPNEVPEGCGLWYWDNGIITTAKRCVVQKRPEDLDQDFLAYLVRRLAAKEYELRELKRSQQQPS